MKRNPEKILNSLTQHSSDLAYKFERLYRLLFNEEMYYIAYQRIYTKQGNMTKGVDGKTIDGFCISHIERLIGTLKDETYQPNPSQRVYIPKKNGKMRPLGIPSFIDKLLQEAIRMILEAIYEGSFENSSHGFRPQRSPQTALWNVQKRFNNTKWFIEGDIKGFFDNIDHEVLIAILSERISDVRFLRLIRKFLNAGYVEDWVFHKSYSGTPQGGIISPILANIYLDRFDKYIKEYAEKFNKGERRRISLEYRRLNNKKTRLAKRLKSITDESVRDKMIAEIKETLAQTFATTCQEPMDTEYRRIQYVRYADDFLIGIIGSKTECITIKADIAKFMAEKLRLELSEEKTLITNAHDKAKFLGYEIFVRDCSFRHKDRKGVIRRFGKGSVMLHVNMDTAKNKLLEYDALRMSQERKKTVWKPKPRAFMIGKKVEDIVAQYNTEIRGFYNYYAIANNISDIGNSFGYIMEYSMYKTIAQKLNLTMVQAKLKFLRDKKFIVPFKDAKGATKYRIFYDGGFKRKTAYRNSLVDIIPNTWHISKPSLMERLKEGVCELCGSNGNITMHHVRNLRQLKGDTPWNAKLIKQNRKTLAVCESCNYKIQTNEH